MFCSGCGAELPSEAQFCARCGLQVATKGDERETSSPAATETTKVLAARASEVEVELASFGRRLGGFLIDVAVVTVLDWAVFISSAIVLAALDGSFNEDEFSTGAVVGASICATLANFFYFLTCNTLGASIGKLALGMRLRRLKNNQVPDLLWGLLRTVVAAVSSLVFYLGYLWAAWDDAVQTWHDKTAGTVVIIYRPDKRVVRIKESGAKVIRIPEA